MLSYQGKEKILLWLGGGFLLFGLLFSALFLSGVSTDLRLALGSEKVTGTVTALEVERNITVNEEHPIRIEFEYQDLGIRRTGRSYSRSPQVLAGLVVGGPVPLETIPGSEGAARVVGSTSGPFGTSTLFVALFPIAGAALLGWAITLNRRQVRAYRYGKIARGLVRSRGFDETVSSNGRHPTKIVWEFHVDGAPYQGELSSFEHAMLNSAVPTDEVVVAYDPAEPRHNTLYF